MQCTYNYPGTMKSLVWSNMSEIQWERMELPSSQRRYGVPGLFDAANYGRLKKIGFNFNARHDGRQYGLKDEW